MRRVLGAVVLAVAVFGSGVACFDFGQDRQTCVTVGRCVEDDAGTPDAGIDAGVDAGMDGGGDAGFDAGLGTGPCPGGVERGEICTSGFCWENPRPTSEQLRAVSGRGDRAVAVGDLGLALRIDGCKISQINLPATDNLRDVRVFGDTWWIVGDDGGVFTSPNGANWSKVSAPLANYVALAAAGPKTVYAGASPTQIIRISDGAEAFGNNYPATNLTGMESTDAGLYAVFGGTSLYLNDGGGWSPVGTAASVSGMWASPSDTLWATTVLNVGETGSLYGIPADGGPAITYDPSVFTVAGSGSTLNAVTGDDDQMLWVAGSGGRLFELSDAGGTWGWRQVGLDVDAGLPLVAATYSDVWSNGSNRTLAVGNEGTMVTGRGGDWMLLRREIGDRGTPAVLDFAEGPFGFCGVGHRLFFICRDANGIWSPQSPKIPGDPLSNVWGASASPNGLLVVGSPGLLEELVGGVWTSPPVVLATGTTVMTGDTRLTLNDVYVAPTGQAFAVGGYDVPDAGLRPALFMRTDAGEFREPGLIPDAGGMFEEVKGTSATDVWMVGSTGFIGHWNGGVMEIYPYAPALRAVAATADGAWFGGVGTMGFINVDGGAMIGATIPDDLNAAVMTPQGPMFSSQTGKVWTWDGGAVLLAYPYNGRFDSIFVTSDGGLFVGGQDETLMRMQ